MTSTQLSPLPEAEAEVTLAIGGMTCGACAARIERRLNALDGIEATVNFATERADVTFRKDLDLEKVILEIESVGYSAIVAESPATGGNSRDEFDTRVRGLGHRLLVAALLLMPLCDASLMFSLLPVTRFAGWQWVVVVLAAPVVTWAAWPFHRAAVVALGHRMATMDTLASLGIVAATVWSVYSLFGHDALPRSRDLWFLVSHQVGGAAYFDVAAGVTTFLLAGRYIEAMWRRRTGDALASLAQVGAKDVAVLRTGAELRIPVGELAVGDCFVVRPGETIASDGEVVAGHSTVDRSAMTGESLPIDVAPSDLVLGGTIALGGRLVVRATMVGGDSQLGQMMRLVEDAQNGKAAVQRLADRVAGVFVPVVMACSLATLLGWLLAGGTAEQAVNASLSVLIIACPCALGLATPMALLVGSGRAASLGVFFKRYQSLEASRQVDTI
ncbi:MAG TPA: HAD-IC family P-type ATPase, partial [Acidimicrobiales bacterium]|nr:HAD-IC family P-type ATPase [Acidimicrobiales bacterium]